MAQIQQNSTIILEDNSQAYSLDSTLMAVMDELVGKPYKHQPKTLPWMREVLRQNDACHRKFILQQGRADFSSHIQELTPEQTVLLYCCHYLQMHLASSRYVFDTCHAAFDGDLPFLNPHSIVIDFGCGPLTSAIALAWYSARVGKPNLRLNYIGIERSAAMIEKARQFSQSRALFCSQSNFDFLQDYTDNYNLTRLLRQYTHPSHESWVVLNFSYFFASPWLNCQELSAVVNQLLQQFPQHRFCILFQNPPGADLNKKWHQFKNSLAQDFQTIAASPYYREVDYYEYPVRSVGKQRLHQPKPPIKLYYEILVK
jgi:SAM-dependent methyltransferase